ncbi:uncharacterized protein [Nicotiana tomentosiformis]|uniref:uncharacterized protein isoform X2 n=1 Tax=Nicotiana tomentosiformis TaxID=4098 RepID=UPI00051C0DE7
MYQFVFINSCSLGGFWRLDRKKLKLKKSEHLSDQLLLSLKKRTDLDLGATIACRGRHQTALLFLLLICRILLATYLLG